MSFVFNINSGYIDKDHWINDPNKGGGRLIERHVIYRFSKIFSWKKIINFSK